MAHDQNLFDGEEGWQPARLIPTSGIKGVDEQEKRATSALLAVMKAVPDFGHSLLRKASAPKGSITTSIEPQFTLATGQKVQPDGAIVVRRGSTRWCSLVEVKTQNNDLRRDQVEAYLDVARECEMDAVITISNQMMTATDSHPVAVDRKKTKRVSLYHWSWVEVLTEAVIQREHRGIDDPDQAWILSELIAYLKHPQSGAMQFQDMGPHWVTVREAAREGALLPHDSGVGEVAVKWDQFIQYLCLHLAGDLGVEVAQVLPRNEAGDPAARKSSLARELVQSKSLTGIIRIKNAISPITLSASLSARTTTASVTIDAPSEGKPATRVNWLTRQLKDAPDTARLTTSFQGVREQKSARLGDLRTDPAAILLPDRSRMPKTFTLSETKEMGTKRGGVSGSFIGEATDLLLSFYRLVVQPVKAWSAPAPKLPLSRDASDIAEEPTNVVSRVAATEAAQAVASLGEPRPDGASDEDLPSVSRSPGES